MAFLSRLRRRALAAAQESHFALNVQDAAYERAHSFARQLNLPQNATRAELISALSGSRLIVASLPEGFDDTDDLEHALRLLPPEGLRAVPRAGWRAVAPSITSREPHYDIHVKAVLCADSDGSNAASISESAIATLFKGLSSVYVHVGLTFVPSTMVLQDTMLNQDFTLPPGVDLTSPTEPISESQKQASFDEHNEARSAWARKHHRGKLVIFFRSGTSVGWDEKTKRWIVGPATFAFSGPEHEFVAMNQGTELLLLAHELGHYFHLSHTHSGHTSLTAAEANQYPNPETDPAHREGRRQLLRAKVADRIRGYVDDQGNAPELGLNALDADGLADTAPDPGPQIFHYEYGSGCAPQSITLDVSLQSGARAYTLDPGRDIIMSYFFRCQGSKRFSEQQIDRIRASLEKLSFSGDVLSRHHLIAMKIPRPPILVRVRRPWEPKAIVSGLTESARSLIKGGGRG